MQQVKPDYTTSIVQVKSGEVIPPTLLRKLVEENQSCCGFVVREPDKLIVEKFHKLDDVEKNYNFMLKIQESTRKYPAMFCFHSFPAEFDEDETMPFVVIKDSKGNAQLVIAVEGDFPAHTNDEYSEPYNLMYDWLGPKIEDMYKLVGNNPTKLFDYLHSAQLQNDFKQVFGHRGVLGFMPSTGDPFVIEQNDLGITGPWGSASNAYGYTESAIAAATPVVTAPAQPAVKKSRYADDSDVTPAPKPEVIPPKVEPAAPKDPAEKVAASLQPEEIDWSPPKGVHGKSLKAAYRAVSGGLPKDWRDRPTIRIQAKKSVKDLKELPSLGVKDMKATEPKPVDKILSMPVISGAQQSKAVDMIKKYLGDGSGVIEEPLKAQEQESKLAKFSELVLKTGKVEEILRWKTEFVFAFVKENPETSALAIIELRNELRKFWLAAKAGDKTLKELVGSEQVTEKPVEAQPQPGPTPTPSEVPVVQPEFKKSKYA